MKKLVCILGAAILLSACASSENVAKADAEAHAACRNTDPPIGSHLVKRSDCGAPSISNPDVARRDAEILQQQQTIRTAPKKL